MMCWKFFLSTKSSWVPVNNKVGAGGYGIRGRSYNDELEFCRSTLLPQGGGKKSLRRSRRLFFSTNDSLCLARSLTPNLWFETERHLPGPAAQPTQKRCWTPTFSPPTVYNTPTITMNSLQINWGVNIWPSKVPMIFWTTATMPIHFPTATNDVAPASLVWTIISLPYRASMVTHRCVGTSGKWCLAGAVNTAASLGIGPV